MEETSLTLLFADESGLCSHDPGASKTGVEIQTQIGLQLDFKVDASLGSENTIKPSYWAKLWQDYHQLSSSCFPLAIPGLSVPGNSLTALPAQSSSAANGSATSANFSLLTGSAYSAYSQPPILPSGLPTAAPLPGNGSIVAVPTGFLRSSLSGVAKSTGVFSTNGQASGTGYPYPIQSSNATSSLPSGTGFTKLPSGTGLPVTPPGNGATPSGVFPPFPVGSGSGSGSGNGPTAQGSGLSSQPSSSKLPISSSGGVSTTSGKYHPIPTGSPPPPVGTAASGDFGSSSHLHPRSSTRRSSSRTSRHRSSTSTKTHTKSTHTVKTTPKAPYPTDTEGAGASTSHSGVASASHFRFRY